MSQILKRVLSYFALLGQSCENLIFLFSRLLDFYQHYVTQMHREIKFSQLPAWKCKISHTILVPKSETQSKHEFWLRHHFTPLFFVWTVYLTIYSPRGPSLYYVSRGTGWVSGWCQKNGSFCWCPVLFILQYS